MILINILFFIYKLKMSLILINFMYIILYIFYNKPTAYKIKRTSLFGELKIRLK